MIERWKRESDFYLVFTGFLTLSITSFSHLPINSISALLIILTVIICLVICFSLSESLLVPYIRRPWFRKLLIVIALFLTPTAPFITHGVSQIIVITFLSGWLFWTREFFYLEQGNLPVCGLCAITLCFMAPALIPFLLIQCYLFFKNDRENAYFLFTCFALPGLLWLVYYWEKNQTILSQTFRDLHPQLFSGDLMETVFALQNQLLSMTQQPVIFIGFTVVLVCLLIQENQSSSRDKSWIFDLNLSLLYCYPLIALVYGSQTMGNHTYLNYLFHFPLFLILLPSLQKFYKEKKSFLSTRLGFFLIIFMAIYPFYLNAISVHNSRPKISIQPIK
tara:strand:- start:259 stop:1260 length:1002 start_codon:yes stop_codon:yes gene_type:complete